MTFHRRESKTFEFFVTASQGFAETTSSSASTFVQEAMLPLSQVAQCVMRTCTLRTPHSTGRDWQIVSQIDMNSRQLPWIFAVKLGYTKAVDSVSNENGSSPLTNASRKMVIGDPGARNLSVIFLMSTRRSLGWKKKGWGMSYMVLQSTGNKKIIYRRLPDSGVPERELSERAREWSGGSSGDWCMNCVGVM